MPRCATWTRPARPDPGRNAAARQRWLGVNDRLRRSVFGSAGIIDQLLQK
jgi:hypothetical protein